MPETGEHQGEANNHPNWVDVTTLAVLTLSLAAIIWYACLTHALLVQGKDHFALQERAWVVFDPRIPWPPLVAGKRYQVELLHRNVGHSIARNIRSYTVSITGARSAVPERVDFKGVPTAQLGLMAPGIDYPSHAWTLTEMNKDVVQAVMHPSSAPPAPTDTVLRTYGLVLYEDDFGKDRGLRLCLEYNPKRTRRFIFCSTGNEAW